ncbi:MAG: hypothetical protein HW405_135 [Candidatus Berkelbacteria bacterium]|nr:hypothetical protein [Candidatus Berkelbacteria bacterium]
MHRRGRNARLWLLIAVVVLTTIAFAPAANAGPLPGAVFTTLVDGSAVNHNIYPTKEDVYLDGGPGNNAPSTAAGLPSGDYYLQVTDPSGKVLLSADPIASRKFHVNAAGVIDYVYPAPTTTKYKGKTYGTHLTSIDQDHAALGAITVQLMLRRHPKPRWCLQGLGDTGRQVHARPRQVRLHSGVVEDRQLQGQGQALYPADPHRPEL